MSIEQVLKNLDALEAKLDAALTAQRPLPVQERNFCPRCGKRTADLTTIHTCTPPHPEREPAAWLTEERYAQLHTAQRPWVGLTDEERLRVLQFIDPKAVRFPLGFKQIAESIERLLKEKNA